MQSRVGQLLISHPNLPENNPFSKTVIYIGHDNDQGVTGLILNRPSSYSLSDFLSKRNLESSLTLNHRMRFGGPVNKQSVFILHSNDWESSSSMDVGKGLSISSDEFMLEKISMGYLPAYWRVFVGVSAWSAGQLEMELEGKPPYRSENSWLTCEANDNIIFNYDGEDQWIKATELASQQMINSYF